jgi:hypothetical protein
VPDGIHPLLLRITDAAGNREAIQASAPIEISNGAASEFAPNKAIAVIDAKLTARFVGRTGASTTVSYARSVAIQGRLVSATGRAIGAAPVTASEAVRGSRTGPKERTVITRADGGFTYHTARRGPSRILRFRYHPAAGNADAVSRSLRVNVRAGATFRVTLRGTRVTYSGRLATLPVPANGKLIQVEGRAAGGTWTAFAAERTTASGGFHGRYRLRIRRPGVRLQFRVRIPKQSNYPYVAATGRAVTRTVR